MLSEKVLFEISSVPLTKPWYLGLANIRGVLASVVDFGAFISGEPTARTPDCRLVFDRPAVGDGTLFPSDHLGLAAHLEIGGAS
jgi:twitching motility protein PilI